MNITSKRHKQSEREYIMKKRWITVLSAVLFVMLIMTAAETKAASKTGAWDKGKKEVQTKGAFTYYTHPSKNGKEAWIYKIKIKGKKNRSLSIPKTIHGKKVTRLGRPENGKGENREAYATLFGTYIEPWHNWDGSTKETSALKSIRIPDTVKVIDRAAFSGLNAVTTIKLPKKIKKIESYAFYGCDKLKTIVLPEQMKSFENSSLWGCPSLKEIKLSKKNKTFEVRGNGLIHKKSMALVMAATAGKEYTIPDGIIKIAPYAFGSAMSPAIHIPASVSILEKGAFNKNPWEKNINIRDVMVSEHNPVFSKDGQCIYNKTDKSLAVAIANEQEVVRISEQVEKLTPDISLVNCDSETLEKLIYPSSLKHVTAPAFDLIRARNIYFTGSVPPEVTIPESFEEDALPVCCHVYVPEASADAYKAWYEGHKCYIYLDGWHTYNPQTEF